MNLRLKRYFLQQTLLGIGIAFFLNCGKTTTPAAVPSPSPSPSTSPTIAAGSGNGQTFALDDFFVNVTPPTGVTVIPHPLGGSWTSPCKVSNGTTGTDLFCLIEAQELDLFDQGLTLNFQVPSNMCAYSVFTPVYFYQYKPGIGPISISYLNDPGAPGSPNLDPITSVSVTASSTKVNGSSISASRPNNTGTTFTCDTDYSKLAYPGPNCCSGSYTLNVTTRSYSGTNAPYTVTDTPSTSTVQWGGSDANCLAGPAMDTQVKNKGGFPESTITATGVTTLNTKYVIASPNSKGLFLNAYIANYFLGEPTFLPASAPLAFKNPYSSGGQATQATYELLCLDNAADIVNRISILVRSWSTLPQFDAQGNPFLTGPEASPFGFHSLFNYPGWVIPGTPPTNDNFYLGSIL